MNSGSVYFRLTLVMAWLAAWLVGATAVQSQSKGDAPELVVAAAADLGSALREIGEAYEKKTEVRLKLSFSASGALTQEIENGAPFDLFFSADMDFPRKLVSSGAADPSSLYQYAEGKLVLWLPSDSPLNVERKGLEVLLDPSVKKVAIANPQFAPYGRAAVAALKHAGLYDRVAKKLVVGENVAQAAQFVESGNAQAGLVALAHAVAPGMQGKGKYWEVPGDDYPPLAQGVVILQRTHHRKQAEELLDYIKSEDALRILEKYGFTNRR